MTMSAALPNRPDPLTPFPDLEGLAVHDVEGLLTGSVYRILTETETGLIRYLDIELAGDQRHVLVPIGHARLEESPTGERRIRLRAASMDDLKEIPAFTAKAEELDPELARATLQAHGRLFRGDRYYAHPAFEHHGLYAGEHPIVPAEQAGPRFAEELALLTATKEFRVASGEPDVVGLPLLDASGAEAGTIEDLVVDTSALRARYLLVQRNADQLLIPVGYTQMRDGAVVMPGLAAQDLDTLPRYLGLPLSRASEEELMAALDRALDARNPFLRVDFSHRQMFA